MKITLSKSQWQMIGNKAGWIRTSQTNFNTEIYKYLIKTLGVAVGDKLYKDIQVDIDKIGVPIRFESFQRGVGGMAKLDVCILSKNSLNMKINSFLFVLFHEIAHYHQYKKYGRDLAMKFYREETTIDEGASQLLQIEEIANRFAYSKANFYIGKYKLGAPVSSQPYATLPEVKRYLVYVRKMVQDNKLTTIDEVNEAIYKMVSAQS